MLTNKVVYASAILAETRAQNGQVILPVPNTPLAELCAAMAPKDSLPVDAESLVQLSAERIEVDIIEDDDAPVIDFEVEGEGEEPTPLVERQTVFVNPHDEVLQAAVQDVVSRIGDAKKIAREEVLPKCRALYPEIEKRVDDFILSPKLVPTVIQSHYPGFYNSDIFRALISDPEFDKDYIEPSTTFKPNTGLASLPGTKLRDLLATGNSEIDSLVFSEAETVTDAALEDIYNRFFRGTRLVVLKEEFAYVGDSTSFIAGRVAAVPAMFCYIWATVLKEDIQEGNSLLSGNYDALMVEAKRAAINGMARIAQDRNERKARGELILGFPTRFDMASASDITTQQIVVSGDCYVSYLKQGGSPEAVTAAVVLQQISPRPGDKTLTVPALLVQNEFLMRKYREYINMKNTEAQNNRLRAYSLAFKGVFNDLILPTIDKDAVEGMVVYVENAANNITDHDVANFQQVFRTHLVNCLYPANTLTVNRLIDEIDTVLADRRELSVFEAVTIATLNLAADYVADQMFIQEA